MNKPESEKTPLTTNSIVTQKASEPTVDNATDYSEILAEAKKLEAEAEKFKALADENYQKLLRAQADFENSRTRMQRTIENNEKYALEKFVRELLPIVDSFEHSLDHANHVDHLKQGLEMILSMLRTTLEKFKIRAIDPLNQPFDPSLHEAMASEPSTDVAPGIVLKVMQKGYQLHDRLLRPARVIVAAEQK